MGLLGVLLAVAFVYGYALNRQAINALGLRGRSCTTVAALPQVLSGGVDDPAIVYIVGVISAAFTLDVYGHVTQKMREDSAARMQHFFDQLTK